MTQGKEWIKQTNVYEVNLRQYTPEGTIQAFSRHLPRLRDMGVETLWFMPITPIAQKNKKGSLGSYYACSDYTAVSPEFGTLEDFKTLVKEAHQLGFKVIIDWVANHTGWDHVWTVTHPDWFEKDTTGQFKAASGMDDIIELDFNNRGMRKAMVDAMRFWIEETGIDGFRCDLAFWVELDFWLEAIPELNRIRPLFWLAEADPLDHPDYMQVFDAAYCWTWMHRSEEIFKKQLPISELKEIAKRYGSINGYTAWFTSNHDENSWNGTEYEKYGEAAKALAVFTITWPGIPLVYSGQELPVHKRLDFFDKDVIEWKEEPDLHSFYRQLLLLKTGHPALHADSAVFPLTTDADNFLFAWLRKKGDKEVLTVLNLSPHLVQATIMETWLSGYFTGLFDKTAHNLDPDYRISLPGWGYQVLVR
jgi:alpha-amylase